MNATMERNRSTARNVSLGDLSDDLVLMNELENLRHVQGNPTNNQSLGQSDASLR